MVLFRDRYRLRVRHWHWQPWVRVSAWVIAINGALQGTARNPEAGGKIMTTMIIGLALIESLCIYALLICFIMVFKIPDLGPMYNAILKSFGG